MVRFLLSLSQKFNFYYHYPTSEYLLSLSQKSNFYYHYPTSVVFIIIIIPRKMLCYHHHSRRYFIVIFLVKEFFLLLLSYLLIAERYNIIFTMIFSFFVFVTNFFDFLYSYFVAIFFVNFQQIFFSVSVTVCSRYQKSNTVNQACIRDKREVPPVRRCQSVQFILSDAIRSNLVPHMIVASSIVVSLCFLPKACLALLNRKLHFGSAIMFDSSILPLAAVPTNLSSLFVSDHMTDHVTAQMRTYESQMYSELTILKTMVLLFNIGKQIDRFCRKKLIFFAIVKDLILSY